MNQALSIPDHVARLRGNRSLATEGQAGLSGGGVPYLSIKGSRFTAVDALGEQRPLGAMDQRGMYLDVIVVDLNPAVSKSYYAEAFDPSATDYKPPTCFSDNGIGPSDKVPAPPATTCAACPMNVWGSKVSDNGKEVKLCSDAKKVAVLLADGTTIPFRLNIPAASLKAWKLHCQAIAAHSADLTMLVTRLRFDPQASSPIMLFEATGWVSPEQADLILATTQEQGKLANLVGRDDKVKQFGAGQQAHTAIAPAQQMAAAPALEAPKPKRAPKAPIAAATPAPFSVAPAMAPGPFMGAPAMAPGPFMGAPPQQVQPIADSLGAHYDAPPMPSFLQRAPAATASPPPAPVFGMVAQPMATDAQLDRAINDALNLPVS